MIFNLVYISKATKPMQDVEIGHLLEQSREWNKSHGITGMLLYIEGSFLHFEGGRFIQALEGEESEIRSIFERIKADNRHYDITKLHESNTYKRNFMDWSMGFKSLNEKSFVEMPGSFSLNDSFLKKGKPNSFSVPLDFLKSFYSMNIKPLDIVSDITK